MKNTLMAVPPLFAQVASPMDRNTLFKNECCWLYAAAALLALLLISLFSLSNRVPF
jgi:hypothetical protein